MPVSHQVHDLFSNLREIVHHHFILMMHFNNSHFLANEINLVFD